MPAEAGTHDDSSYFLGVSSHFVVGPRLRGDECDRDVALSDWWKSSP